jgi:alkylation response protein AidB-like acyl-CoA dehydrogenase
MDFAETSEQGALRETARRIFGGRAADESWRRAAATPYDAELWRTLAEAGLLGTAVPEDQGGSALGLQDLALVLEEAGRSLAPVPLLQTLVLGALPIARFAKSATREAILPGVVAGERVLTAALWDAGQTDLFAPGTGASRRGDGWQLTGAKIAVPYGAQASHVLVSAATDAGARVFVVDPRAAGCTLTPQASITTEPHATLALAGATAVEMLGGDADGASVLPFLVEHAQVGAAFALVGLADEALRRTAEFQANRIQFGRPLGSFQAVQQRAANGYIDVAAMRATAQKAAYALEAGLPAGAIAGAAYWWACRGADRVVHTAQHQHGGTGADTSYPIHRFFLAAKQLSMLLGGAAPALERIGRELAAGRVRPLTLEAMP